MNTSTLETDKNQPNYLLRRIKAGGALALIAVAGVGVAKDITNNGGGPNIVTSPYTMQQAEQIPRVPVTAPEGPEGTVSAMIENVNGDTIKNNVELVQLETVVENEHPSEGPNTTGGEHYEIPDVALANNPSDS
jgi:hypothetical protein